MSDDNDPTVPEPVAAASRRSVPSRPGSERYRIGEQIGHGGMGEVMAAHDMQLGREVAIKRMLVKDPTELALRRFLREAQIQGRLEHPAIVPVHELGHDPDGLPFFAMKRLSGTTLKQILGDPAVAASYSQNQLLRAFADVCVAVEFAHTRGIIHRDLKPANVMLGEYGEVYVLDWGVAKVVGDAADEVDQVDSNELVTMAGTAIGTPGYMAPEQVGGASTADQRADVYALGCILFEILAGAPLHPRGKAGLDSAVRGIDARASVRAPSRTVPPELDELCARATATARAERIASARELGDRVLRYVDGDRDLALRRQLARGHLAAAQQAFAAAADEHARATAIREAGRSLALDPELGAAADLVSRLMLEPPATLPREVELELAAELAASDRRHAKISTYLAVGYLGFLPFLISVESWAYVAVFVGVIALNVVFVLRRTRTAQSWLFSSLPNATIVGLIARAFSPFWLAPALAAVVTSVLLYNAAYTRTRTLVSLVCTMVLAVIVPWLAELAGLVSPTMELLPKGIAFYTRNNTIGDAARYVGILVFSVGVVVVTAAIAHAMLRAERASRRHVYLHAWQLRQLVPRSNEAG